MDYLSVSRRHGDMLYMTLEERTASSVSMGPDGAEAASFSLLPLRNGSSTSSSTTFGSSTNGHREDEVDTLLAKQDGKIYRDRNEQL